MSADTRNALIEVLFELVKVTFSIVDDNKKNAGHSHSRSHSQSH